MAGLEKEAAGKSGFLDYPNSLKPETPYEALQGHRQRAPRWHRILRVAGVVFGRCTHVELQGVMNGVTVLEFCREIIILIFNIGQRLPSEPHTYSIRLSGARF
jgi:hypothetical protein